MGVKVGLLLLFVLGMACASDARKLVVSGLSGEDASSDNVCSLCDKYVTLAFDYLEDNKTQTEIIEALHVSCSQIPTFKQQCLALVDYYAPLFFLKLSLIEPEEFCRKVDLCETVVSFASKARQDSCETCRQTVSELLIKLKDPETELEIIELLWKACKKIKKYEKKCKELVFEYGPVILVNAEQFLEKTDVCTILHACPAPKKASEQVVDVPAVSDS